MKIDVATTSIAMECDQPHLIISTGSEETVRIISVTGKNCKVSIRKCVVNFALCFCIICAVVFLCERFVGCFLTIQSATTP